MIWYVFIHNNVNLKNIGLSVQVKKQIFELWKHRDAQNTMQSHWSRLYNDLLLKLDAPDAGIVFGVNVA